MVPSGELSEQPAQPPLIRHPLLALLAEPGLAALALGPLDPRVEPVQRAFHAHELADHLSQETRREPGALAAILRHRTPVRALLAVLLRVRGTLAGRPRLGARHLPLAILDEL